MLFTIPAIDVMAMECSMQLTDAKAVGWLADAVYYAHDHRKEAMTVDMLSTLNAFITRNKGQVRTTPVAFANGNVIPAVNIEERLNKLIIQGELLTADEWLKEFLDIHPYNDGNGRLAFVLWNTYFGNGRFSGSIAEPVCNILTFHPDFYAGKA